MKPLRYTLVAASIALGAAGMADAADFTMRLSHQFPPSHHTTHDLEFFAQQVEEQTDGKVEVQLFGSSQLYKPSQHLAAVAGGRVESAVIYSIQWGGNLPEMAVTQIPFLMNTPEKQDAFIKSDAARLLDDKMLEKGVKNMAWLFDSDEQIFTSSTKLLDEPKHFEGLKMRGYNKLFDAGLVAMGATTVSMAGSEAYQALQTNVVDAALTAMKAAHTRKYYEVQKYGAAVSIFPGFANIVVNPKWFASLPEDIQAGIAKAADAAVEKARSTYSGVNEDDIKLLNDEGMEAVALNDEQIAAFKKIMLPAIRDEFLKSTGDSGQALIDMVEAL